MRLLLCLGLTTAASMGPAFTGVVVDLRAGAFFLPWRGVERRSFLLEAEGLSGARGLGGGLARKKTDGDGMVMASAI